MAKKVGIIKNSIIKNGIIKNIIFILKICIGIILLYSILYWLFFRPVFKLQEYQNKKWITDLTHKIMLGVNDKSKFADIGRVCNFISFWYCYWFFHTEKYTIWILFNLQNKFSGTIVLNFYVYDFSNDALIKDQVVLDFNNLKTREKSDGIIVIELDDAYYQEIDFAGNTSVIKITTNKINFMMELDIDDYTTNQGSFIPRYQLLNHLVNTEGNETGTPHDWMSDNPFIGKIRTGRLNQDVIETGGNFWFDNFIGCNNNFLSSYIWFVVMNDDWLIYLLWYDTYDTRNNIGTTKPILIKDRKNNRFIHAGTPGLDCKNLGFPLDNINYMLQPVSMTYDSKKKIGVPDYDDYHVSFKSGEIDIHITSIPGKSKQVYEYDYYKNGVSDSTRSGNSMNEWDKKYYDVISNIRYVEYVNMVNVEIKYNNKIERFEARQVIDAMYPKNSLIPKRIKYSIV